MTRRTVLLVAVACVTLAALIAVAAPPQLIRYQGRLTDDAGVAVTGSHDLSFAIYDVDNGGTALWSEGPRAVTLGTGIADILLGEVTPLPSSVFTASDRWLEVTVDGNVLGPRQRLSSLPYAHASDRLGDKRLAEVLDRVNHTGAQAPATISPQGTGSDLDADTLDGLDSTQFLTGASGWTLSGNAGTTPGAEFLGTTDNQRLEIHVNASRALVLVPELDSPTIIAGHSSNSAGAGNPGATVSGGGYASGPNQANAAYATVAGGHTNTVTGNNSTISGGAENTVGGDYSVIGGGQGNSTVEHAYATIGGGYQNSATNASATVGGGRNNSAGGIAVTVCGGQDNSANLDYATVPGGQDNRAYGRFSFAAGRHAHVDNHQGTFLWADSTDTPLVSNTHNEFRVRASGGVVFLSNPEMTTGVYLSAGGGAWNTLSDVRQKRELSAVDPLAVLSSLMELPVQTWSYRSQRPSVRHIGPTSQDFAEVFGFGESDVSISTIDADGVALASIQGLYRLLEERTLEIENLQHRLEELEFRIMTLTDSD